jgi:hypothetical protein
MTKSRKKPDVSESRPPRVGDKVAVPPSESIREITYVSRNGDEVNLQAPGTNLEWFRVRTDKLKFVDRKPPPITSNPFTKAEPVLDTEEVLRRIETIQRDNLERLDDDMDTLKDYLKAQKVPKAAITAVESLTVEHHVGWKKTLERIEKLLGEE